jgi:hypothetical protein
MLAAAGNLSSPRVSIVMPCHLGTARQAELLAETLQTVTDQTFQDYDHFG